MYDFGTGRTNPETFPAAAFAAAAQSAIEREYEDLNRYPGELGHAGLRALLARRESEREGVAVSPEQIALTNGSMQAVTLVAQALSTGDRDIVVTEEYTYSGTISAYRDMGLEMVGVPGDEQGMRMEALEAALNDLTERGDKPRFIYTLATYQNPTGAVMPTTRRHRLLTLARQFDIPVVEDNCYGDVHYDGDKPPAFYALDNSPQQIHIGSLSKILAPGVRLGYVLAREPMFRRILDRRHDAGSNTLAAAIVNEFFGGDVWSHCAAVTPALKEKRDLLMAGLDRDLADLCLWSHPVGGLFAWLRYPDDVDQAKLTLLAEERGLIFVPGQSFHVRGEPVPYMRLAFGHTPNDAITAGTSVLSECLRAARTSNERPGYLETGSLFE
jgi:2-aminoadipate transaminase